MSALRRLVISALLALVVVPVPARAAGAQSTTPDKPIGALELASERDPNVSLDHWAYEGWMWDPTGTAAYIFISVDGVYVSDWASKESIERPDIAAAHPGAPSDTGFRILGDGHAPSTACAYAVNADETEFTLLSCIDVPADAPHSPVGALDVAEGPGDGSLTVKGWAADDDAPGPTSVALSIDGAYIATFSTGVARPDVQAAFPFAGPNAGYEHTEQRFLRGRHHVCTQAINGGREGRTITLGCVDVDLPMPYAPVPLGALDSVSETAGAYMVWGWMFDPVTPYPGMHLVVNGVRVESGYTRYERPDVVAAYPNAPPDSGFVMFIANSGPGDVCVVAQNFYGDETTLGCLPLPPSFEGSPAGVVDDAVPEAGRIVLRGWAVEPDPGPPLMYAGPDERVAGPSEIHVYMDGLLLLVSTVDQPRPDVQAAIPNAGPDDGFQVVVPARPGEHDVCVYAINRGPHGRNTTLGCRHVGVPATTGPAPSPFGYVDAEVSQVRPGPGIFDDHGFTGWAAAPSGAPATVRVVGVGGFYGGAAAAYDVTGPTGLERPDVPMVFPGVRGDTGYLVMAGGGHIFHYRLACVSARDPNTGAEAVLGCASYTFNGLPGF